jgi:signal transduction histidine kinase
MHASEWASIFFNLYSNAVKAIKRANSKGCILIRVGRDDDRIYLEFADNGDGIPPENRDRIFNAFFTTSTPIGVNANEIEELQGTGLGLKIVKDIAESYGGEVVLTTPPDGYATSFRVEVPGLDTSEEGEDDAS